MTLPPTIVGGACWNIIVAILKESIAKKKSKNSWRAILMLSGVYSQTKFTLDES